MDNRWKIVFKSRLFSPLHRTMRTPSPWMKHSHGANKCCGGQADGPVTLNVMLDKAAAALDADAAAAAFRDCNWCESITSGFKADESGLLGGRDTGTLTAGASIGIVLAMTLLWLNVE